MASNMFLSRGKSRTPTPPGDTSHVEDPVPHFYDLKGLAHLNATSVESFTLNNRVYARSALIERAMSKAFNTEIQAAFQHTFAPAQGYPTGDDLELNKSRVIVFFPNGRITILRVDTRAALHTEEPLK